MESDGCVLWVFAISSLTKMGRSGVQNCPSTSLYRQAEKRAWLCVARHLGRINRTKGLNAGGQGLARSRARRATGSSFSPQRHHELGHAADEILLGDAARAVRIELREDSTRSLLLEHGRWIHRLEGLGKLLLCDAA